MKFFFGKERASHEAATSREKLPQSCYHYFLNLRTIREGFCRLTTQYRANFLSVYLLGRLGKFRLTSHQTVKPLNYIPFSLFKTPNSTDRRAIEPKSHENIYLYLLFKFSSCMSFLSLSYAYMSYIFLVL